MYIGVCRCVHVLTCLREVEIVHGAMYLHVTRVSPDIFLSSQNLGPESKKLGNYKTIHFKQ